MAEILRSNERWTIDYMARDFDSFVLSMRQLIPEKLPEWKDFESEADFGNVLVQLFAHMGDILSYYQDRVANESFLGTARTRRSVIHHLALIGYRLATAAPASASLTVAVAADFNDVLTIRRGDAFATKSAKDRPSVRFEYTREEDLTIDCSTLPAADGKKQFPGVPVEEGRLVQGEVLGTSDGTPHQSFRLVHPRLILRSLGQGREVHRDIAVHTEQSGIRESWTLRESLVFSGEDQRHFAVDIDEEDRATITFGDGTFGRIPPADAVVRATYRVGGGVVGNVARDTIVTVADASELALAGATVSNPERATGGAERETIDHAVTHAPTVFRSLKRAVTAADYEALARDFAGVGKVRAKAGSWNTVTLYVAPQGGGRVSDVLEGNLLAYFEDKRPISTRIEIEDVDYVRIYVAATVGVVGYYSRQLVEEQVRQAAGALLAFDAVDFGQTLYLSKFYEAIEALAGVEYVTIDEFRRDPPADDEEPGKLVMAPWELATIPEDAEYAGGIRVTAEGGF
ncbi:MAG: hypothetical protein GY856_06415 [bacterium]|nr:hypothetical protein [bacterium]